MADRKPIKVLPDGGGDSAGLAEFVAADTIGVVDGGTGLATVATSNILTGNGTSALSAESNLTFDGSTLTVLGNAGVGIARTEGTLHVHTATAGSVTAATNADELVVENSAAGGISILTPDANDGILKFGSPTLNYNGSISVNHNSNAPYMDFNVDSARRMRITDAGLLHLNETANGDQTIGMTINQAANTDEILSFKSSDVAHGMTHVTESDTFAYIGKSHGTIGGLEIVSASDSSYPGMYVKSFTVAPHNESIGSAAANIQMQAGKRDSSSYTSAPVACASNENMFLIQNLGVCRVLVTGDGTVYASDTSWATAFSDDMPDALAGRAYRTDMAERAGGVRGGLSIHSPELVKRMEETGIVTVPEGPETEEPGARFINVQKGIKFSWDMGFQNFSFLAEIAKVLSDKQRAALPPQMQDAFAILNDSQMEIS